MTILLYETVAADNYFTAYKDSEDDKLFYFVPAFAEVSRRQSGRLNFGAQLFKKNPNDPNDGISVYNFGVTCVTPSSAFANMKSRLEVAYGKGIRLSAISPDIAAPKLVALTEGIYRNQRCQTNGANLYTDLACSLTVDESLEPDMSNFFKSTTAGWAGVIYFTVRTKKTSFEWKITANWRRIQEHFKSQLSVRYWFVRSNISYETKKLIQDERLKIEITGGTPEQIEMVYTFAEKIATRLFVPTLQLDPLPAHPSGGAVCFSLNYSKVEEDKSSIWMGRESAFENKELGVAAYVGSIPNEYFSGFDGKRLEYDLDRSFDSQTGFVDPDSNSLLPAFK